MMFSFIFPIGAFDAEKLKLTIQKIQFNYTSKKPRPKLSLILFLSSSKCEKMKKALFVCLLVGPFFALSAQENDLANTEQLVNYVLEHIEKGDYYKNELNFNAQRFSLHQPGYFQQNEIYYYTFDQLSGDPNIIILKALVFKLEKDEVSYLKKFIYDNAGKLIFYQEEQKDQSNQPSNRLNVYISNGNAIKWLEEDNLFVSDAVLSKKKLTEIQQESAVFTKKFEEQIKEIQTERK